MSYGYTRENVKEKRVEFDFVCAADTEERDDFPIQKKGGYVYTFITFINVYIYVKWTVVKEEQHTQHHRVETSSIQTLMDHKSKYLKIIIYTRDAVNIIHSQFS